jgi:D-alanyl-D-alanine carboxypeptidase
MSFVSHKTKISFTIIALYIVLWVHPALAKTHHHKSHSHAGVARTASYADIVIDADTGQILHSTNADSLRHPASLTKMMTLYLTFQALEAGKINLRQSFSISANASEQSPSKLGLRRGQTIRVEDAIMGLVTESANDAAVVLAEGLGGSTQNFARMMTKQAHALGMNHTNFDNPSGLPDDAQVTTARDMAILGDALIHHYPQFYPYFSTDSFTYAGIYHHNHNHLMDRYDGMDGIKTGYIRASGFNLVASAKRGGTRLIGAVFGGHSATARDNQMAQLLDDAFARAQSEKASPRAAAAHAPQDDAQGDTADDDGEVVHYVTLPAKIAAVFTPTPPAHTNGQPVPVSLSNPAPAPTPLTKAQISSQSWGIQIGAYSDVDVGRAALANAVSMMPAMLGSAEKQIIPLTTTNGVTVYRARLVNIDMKSAQTACSSLMRQGINCLTIEP